MVSRPPPLTLSPAVPVIADVMVAAVAAAGKSIVPPPIRFNVPPDSVTLPSSKLTAAAVCAPLTLTVKVPIASVPAEKTALLPADHAPVGATVPAALLLQKLFVPQVPAGVTPAPSAAPLPSQYNAPARAAGASQPGVQIIAHAAKLAAALTRTRRDRRLLACRLRFPFAPPIPVRFPPGPAPFACARAPRASPMRGPAPAFAPTAKPA